MASSTANLQHDQALERLEVRTYQPDDQTSVARLYTDGLLEGQIAANDSGADIENIIAAYFGEPSSHFWVAELDGQVLGMIGAAREEEHTAEIRRLRVDQQWQDSTIGEKLVEIAIAHIKHHGFLKAVLDTRFERDTVISLFDRFGFQHTRSKTIQDKELLEFYLDLYRPTAGDTGE